MTKLRKCSRCGLYGHNKATCKKTDAQITEEKRLREIRQGRLNELVEKHRTDQLWALVALVNSVASQADIPAYLELDGTGVVFLEVMDIELEGADAVHALTGALASSKYI
tara:strand:+ start:9818 stop:10147 length:330 start_codon:yes stop_codon:yes gene_type:complete